MITKRQILFRFGVRKTIKNSKHNPNVDYRKLPALVPIMSTKSSKAKVRICALYCILKNELKIKLID